MVDPLSLLKQIEELYSQKHLPGRHDQKRHAGGRSSYGGIDYVEHIPSQSLVPGYTDDAVERAANWILTREGPEPDYIDNMLDATDWGSNGRTLGQWSLGVLSTIRPKRLVSQSEGVLNSKDLDNLRSFDKDIWVIDREYRSTPNSSMPDVDLESQEAEYGVSRYAMHLVNKPVGDWKYVGNGKIVIEVNQDAEKVYGLDKRFVFWHEFGHTISTEQVSRRIGDIKPIETNADYMDRFAEYMSK